VVEVVPELSQKSFAKSSVDDTDAEVNDGQWALEVMLDE
jgi:hypothetical protein